MSESPYTEETMSLQLGPLKRAKTYELVVKKIKDEIFAGRLRPGDRLPGERQMSELLNVSRPSVREAIRILEAMEIVRSRPGNGVGSGLVVSTEPSRALSDLLGVHVALSSYSVPEVLSVRMALEVQAVRRIATRVASIDLSQCADTLQRMADPLLDRESFLDLDTEFHVGLARASNNLLLGDLMAALREAVRRPMADAFDNDNDWAERAVTLMSEHTAIFEAVSQGHADEAESLVRHHIEGFYLTDNGELPEQSPSEKE
ncbi:putative transcription regulator [marine actinobacterium PHSC20C1]|nr:putative transcription regulator [marine actinobacterium PHSC20C1]